MIARISGRILIRMALVYACTLPLATPLAGQAGADSVMVRIRQADLQSAVQILGQYLDRPVLFTGQSAALVTLETPDPVPRGDILRLLAGVLDANGYELMDDTLSGLFRARPKEVARPATPPQQVTRAAQPQSEPELFVLTLKHARATDVAATIGALYGRSSGSVEEPERPETLGDELRANLLPTPGTATARSGGPPTGQPAALSGSMTIVPDAQANTLLLRVNRADFELIRSLVEQIDIRPLQVLIEVLIAEVRRDKSLAIGVDGALGTTPIAGTDLSVSAGLGTPGLGDFALTVMGIGGVDADATLTLAAQRGTVRIVSRPVVLATNNQLAEIVVGSQRPFVQVQRSLPTDAVSRDQIVQYKEVGTKLTVTPSISDDGSVHLDVTQEVSNATSETAFDAPVISTRSVHTQLLVRDGQTVVLGGLTDRQRDETRTGLPLLSRIPLIGGLFGSSRSRMTETELFVFLTPRVIRTDDDAMRLTTPIRDRVRANEP